MAFNEKGNEGVDYVKIWDIHVAEVEFLVFPYISSRWQNANADILFYFGEYFVLFDID